MNFTLDRFYQLLVEATVFYPKSVGVCQIPKTCGVIQHLSDMNLPNLGKTFDDYDKGFFYSERWRSAALNPNNIIWDFPLVAANYFSGTISGFNTGNSQVRNNVTVGVYDIVRDPSKTPTGTVCNQRLAHEVESDCEKALIQILNYVDTAIFAELNGVPNYYAEPYLQYRKANGATVKVISRPKIISSSGSPFYITHPDTGIEYTYGAEVRVDVLTNFCPSNDLDMKGREELVKITSCCG